MKNKFNKTKYNIERLKPRPEDIELNKCTHEIFDKDDGKCAVCETVVSPNIIFNQMELWQAIETVSDHLECMKMIVNSCMSRKEAKAAQKYFDMIPLLNNLEVLYDICIDELNTTDLDIIDLYEPLNIFSDNEELGDENNE